MKKIVLLLMIGLTFTACEMGASYSEHKEFSDILWHKIDQPRFEFEITKEANYSIALDLRLVYGYTYRNIKLDVAMANEDTKTSFPLNFEVRNEDDSYKGDVMGDIIDIQHVIIIDTLLPKGKYSFVLDEQMDKKTLPFVMEVGIVLNENTKK